MVHAVAADGSGSATGFVDHINLKYFAGGLSPAVLTRLRQLPDRDDVRGFVERLGRLTSIAGLDPRDVSPLQADILSSLIARLLPETWDGRVPPITIPGRHRKFDELVRIVAGPSGRLLEIACGFPPFTSIESAQALPGWDIVGVDRALPEYLVEDGLGNYAVYDEGGAAQYFQPISPTTDSWWALLNDTSASRRRLEDLLRRLLEVRATGGRSPDRLEHEGATLIVHPVREYTRENLRFMRADLEGLETEPADVLRCFNMLLYFDDAFRARAIQRFAHLLAEGGIAICGTDWAFSAEARYATYRKRGGRIVPQEFAFSLDNFVPIGVLTWYTLQSDDRDAGTLASLCGVLRSDRDFVAAYAGAADALRAEMGLCPRQPDGFLGELDTSIPPGEMWVRAGEYPDRLGARLNDHAINVLTDAGYAARVNEVGHIAVKL